MLDHSALKEEFGFCPTLLGMLQATDPTLTGETGKECRAGGMSTVNNLYTLRQLILKRKPKKTLEVGFLFGTSALCIAGSSAEAGISEAKRHHAIDPFQSTTWDNIGRMKVREAGLGDAVTVHENYSCFVLAQLCQAGERFDLIYIDGSHIFEDVLVDFYFAWQLLNIGGVVLMDDCTDPHVKKVVKFVQTNLPAHMREMDLTSFRPAARGLKRKIASHLGISQMRCFEKTQDGFRDWDARFKAF